jgi:hypothetical protein
MTARPGEGRAVLVRQYLLQRAYRARGSHTALNPVLAGYWLPYRTVRGWHQGVNALFGGYQHEE